MCCSCKEGCRSLRAVKEFSNPRKYAPEVEAINSALVLRSQIFLFLVGTFVGLSKCELAWDGECYDNTLILNETFVDFFEYFHLTRRILVGGVSAALLLASVWFPSVAEYFILVPMFAHVTALCGMPRNLSDKEMGMDKRVVELIALFGFVSKKQLLFVASIPALISFLPRFTVLPEERLTYYFNAASYTAFALMVIHVVYTGAYRLMRLMGSHRFQA